MEKKKSHKNLRDLKTHQRIVEHIGNEKDVISEDDIKNAQTNFGMEVAAAYRENFEKDRTSSPKLKPFALPVL